MSSPRSSGYFAESTASTTRRKSLMIPATFAAFMFTLSLVATWKVPVLRALPDIDREVLAWLAVAALVVALGDELRRRIWPKIRKKIGEELRRLISDGAFDDDQERPPGPS